jgi:hypothetical protein
VDTRAGVYNLSSTKEKLVTEVHAGGVGLRHDVTAGGVAPCHGSPSAYWTSVSAQSSVLRDGRVDNVRISLYIYTPTHCLKCCVHSPYTTRCSRIRLYQHTHIHIPKLITPTRKAEENTWRTRESAVGPGGNGPGVSWLAYDTPE